MDGITAGALDTLRHPEVHQRHHHGLQPADDANLLLNGLVVIREMAERAAPSLLYLCTVLESMHRFHQHWQHTQVNKLLLYRRQMHRRHL